MHGSLSDERDHRSASSGSQSRAMRGLSNKQTKRSVQQGSERGSEEGNATRGAKGGMDGDLPGHLLAVDERHGRRWFGDLGVWRGR